MDPYEYLTVFISVVLGLAVVRLLSGISLILDTRVRQRVDWIHFLWTVWLVPVTFAAVRS